jgi:short-subunit dehydrogenase involved in D-alanine esterification of teichoic acids
MKLSGRTVLVTGGTSGIGLGIAEAFHGRGSRVIICGRDWSRLSAVEEKFPGITALSCDVGDGLQRKNLATDVMHRFPDLDILVNNAGIQRYVDLKKGYDELKSGGDEIAINFVSAVELSPLHRPPDEKTVCRSHQRELARVRCRCEHAHLQRDKGRDPHLHPRLAAAAGHIGQVIEIVPTMVDTGLNRLTRRRPSQAQRVSLRNTSDRHQRTGK